jgi:hypothetical protein
VHHGVLHLVRSSDVRLPAALQTGDGLLGGEGEVGAHHAPDGRQRPVLRVRGGEERGDAVGVPVPAGLSAVQRGRVARLRRLQDLDGDQDVLAEQGRELAARSLAVERRDRVADVGLVPEQPRQRRVERRRAGGKVDDREPRPLDVLEPQAAHLGREGGLGGGRLRRGRMRLVVRVSHGPEGGWRGCLAAAGEDECGGCPCHCGSGEHGGHGA